MNKQVIISSIAAMCLIGMPSCKEKTEEIVDTPTPLPEWYYTGGKLGTTPLATMNCFEQPTPATERGGLTGEFDRGDQSAERPYTTNATGTRNGLGPVYVRSSCQHCHPNYSHGTSIPEGTYSTSRIGNGTLLVVYNPETEAYVSWLAGMPQLHGVKPFKAPLDEKYIRVHWEKATDQWGNRFPDGEQYKLVYPVVTMDKEAIYSARPEFAEAVQALGLSDYDVLADGKWEVRLENTIGIYGTGLLDAIPEDSIVAQWAKEEQAGVKLNTAYFEGGQWKNYYSNKLQGDGTPYVRRFTYAMSRGPLQDGAGANAIWNIPNVTRNNRRYHYLDLNGKVYATCASIDPEVQAGFADYIAKIDPDKTHEEWHTDDVQSNIYNYLTSKSLPVEMTDDEFVEMMVWHRGLAVPAARNVTDKQVLRGREVFAEVGCEACHRPSWTTGQDDIQDPNLFFTNANSQLPRYQNQKIWPYTDMVQHKLHMEKDIRTGWCRTTPLWGRGLHRLATGDASEARMHDTRARNVIEAIMWHFYSEESDAYWCADKFRNLSKEDREAMVAFINAI